MDLDEDAVHPHRRGGARKIRVELTGAAPGNLTYTWGEPAVNVTEGRITVAGAGITALAGPGSLVELQFAVRDAAASSSSPLHADLIELNDSQIPVRSTGGQEMVSEQE